MINESEMTRDSRKINQDYYENLWGETAIDYLSKSAGARWFKTLLLDVLQKVDENAVKTIVDIGCGVGLKAALMAEYFNKANVMGCDFSAPAIRAAQNNHKISNLSFSTTDITQLNNKDKYDLITIFDVLEHIDNWKGLADNLINLNNRYMIISVPTGRMRPYETDIGHVRNFKKGEIESYMESKGYKAMKLYYAGFPFYSPLLRDLTNLFSKKSSELPTRKMGLMGKLFHNMWYFLFRYCSFKNKGDIFIGLFEKQEK